MPITSQDEPSAGYPGDPSSTSDCSLQDLSSPCVIKEMPENACQEEKALLEGAGLYRLFGAGDYGGVPPLFPKSGKVLSISPWIWVAISPSFGYLTGALPFIFK